MTDLTRRHAIMAGAATLLIRPNAAIAQAPLRIEVNEGVIEPIPFAAPSFLPDDPSAAPMAEQISRLVVADLVGTGLFREVPRAAHIAQITNFDAAVNYADWQAIQAQALITGSVGLQGDRVIARFRLWDVFAQTALGEGLQFAGTTGAWRRMGHKVADEVYSRLTGEGGYFDSRVAYIAVSGPKNARRKQLSIMDYDGANSVALTDGSALVLTPRMARSARQILFTSYAQGAPKIFLLAAGGEQREVLSGIEGMTFAPRFSPDEGRAVLSLSEGDGSDIFVTDLVSGARARLTQGASIDTAPCFSPDGGEIVFESDRSGVQQLYIMSAVGGEARRISFGSGRYATPVWSPRGDRIAFTKIEGGQFHIGVMNADGSNEKLLTSSYIDEGPSWAPNGRVIMFFRETPGDAGGPKLFTIDVTGRNLREVATSGFASDPSWSGLLS